MARRTKAEIEAELEEARKLEEYDAIKARLPELAELDGLRAETARLRARMSSMEEAYKKLAHEYQSLSDLWNAVRSGNKEIDPKDLPRLTAEAAFARKLVQRVLQLVNEGRTILNPSLAELADSILQPTKPTLAAGGQRIDR